MADTADKNAVKVVTEISYCPHLGLYRHRTADGSDYMFDTDQLEKAIESYIKGANARQAEFMALLTGMARQHPHQVLSFDEQGVCVVRDLKPAELSQDPENSSSTSKSG